MRQSIGTPITTSPNVYFSSSLYSDFAEAEFVAIPVLVEQLSRFHRACFMEFLPLIEADLASVQKTATEHPLFLTALGMGLKALKDDFRIHFAYEEAHLYPYALALYKSEKNLPDYNCDKFLSEHPIFRINLSELIGLVERYAADFSTNFAFRMLHERLRTWHTAFLQHESLEDYNLIGQLRALETA